jgi:hypothetical protein
VQREIKIGSVSWINETPNPVWAAVKAKLLDPAWLVKTYIGLVATANPPAPSAIEDFRAFQGDKQFRALTYCHIRVTIDDGSWKITAFEVLDAVHDPGWTPPFKVSRYPTTGVFTLLDGWNAFTQAWSGQYHQGEASPLSLVNTQARHNNTTITSIPTTETVLVNSLIKFRAGSFTDQVGIKTVGCPYHVPWVWCETVLTYASGRFMLYGRGSVFPSHAWYIDGKQVMQRAQVSDSNFPSKRVPILGPPPGVPVPYMGPRLSIPNPLSIDVGTLAIYPVLSRGAPAAGPQATLTAESGLTGSVETHPYTVSGGPVVTFP